MTRGRTAAAIGVAATGRSGRHRGVPVYRDEAGRIAGCCGTPFHAHLPEQGYSVISAVTVRIARPRMWPRKLKLRNAGLASSGTPIFSTSRAWTTKK